jgi:histidinol-phosphate/aromatic aminotransferase/cobyric acid decarboxylase-like protein
LNALGKSERSKFPLADWLDRHVQARHNLGLSGMGRELASTRPLLRHPSPASVDEVQRLVARSARVDPARVFLTHGATEGNAVALFTLARTIRTEKHRAPTVRILQPEYPPLGDAARFAGFKPASPSAIADLAVLSDPNNPTGRGRPSAELKPIGSSPRRMLVDETFREFTSRPSVAQEGCPGVWVTGTLTKVYGADEVRVGWIIVAPGEGEELGAALGLLTDGIAAASRAQAAALLRNRKFVLAEARRIFTVNRRALGLKEATATDLLAPVFFDRLPRGVDGTTFARAALRRGILVAPGSFFGIVDAVRLCLTRRSFPRDYAAYARFRRSFLGSSHRRTR